MSLPIKLLNEAQGHVVSLELVTGDTYRGRLIESEDNMNLQLRDATVTKVGAQGGEEVVRMDTVFIRGSQVRFITVPDLLKHAPLFKKSTLKPQPPIRGPRGKPTRR